jgi:hypothetical protein
LGGHEVAREGTPDLEVEEAMGRRDLQREVGMEVKEGADIGRDDKSEVLKDVDADPVGRRVAGFFAAPCDRACSDEDDARPPSNSSNWSKYGQTFAPRPVFLGPLLSRIFL